MISIILSLDLLGIAGNDTINLFGFKAIYFSLKNK